MNDWLSQAKNSIVALQDCDLDDETYRVPCYNSLQGLIQSIDRVGLLCKPVMQEQLDGRLVPVLGRRRIQALREMGMSEVRVKILSQRAPEAECYQLAFWDNISHRELELPSKAFVIKRLLELFPRLEVASRFLPVLGINPWGPRIEELKLLNRIHNDASVLLASGRLNEKTALIMARLDPRGQECCRRILDELKPNVNKSHELISGLFDLSVNRGCTVQDIVQSTEFASMKDSPGKSSKEKIHDLRSWLRRTRYPELHGEELEFQEWLKQQQLPKNVAVRPQEAFEDPTCTIEIRSLSRMEAQELLKKLDLTP